MEMRQGSVHFPLSRGSGPRTRVAVFNFNRAVTQAIVGISGYSTGFRSKDHHLGRLELSASTEINDDVVTTTVTYGLRDWSGSWDDDNAGTINLVALAELADPSLPPPRSDLSIIGLEFNQATQYFRSFLHLDGPNVRPDNSMPLIARKSTGVRVYVDYDAASGLPAINQLSGELQVITSTGASFPVAPQAVITPRRDTATNRAVTDHTLNFVIPEVWCQGDLTIRCTAFDQADPGSISGMAQRTLRFRNSEPLRVYAVGVHYTGQGLDLAAPAASTVLSALAYVEKTYPVPEINQTGYSVLDFDRDLQADIKDGCGSGFNALLNDLRDMRGESSDIYYAVVPSGANTGSVGGCGGGGVGAGSGTSGRIAAEEIGHAFGLAHAPCSSCSTTPANPDGNYPQYGSYSRDSIGEFGYDPATNFVHDPASVHDFMGYSSPEWVSPYTYRRLMDRFPDSSGLSGSASAFSLLRAVHVPEALVSPDAVEDPQREAIRQRSMTLFLALNMSRERRATRVPSFHFPAWPRPEYGNETEFTVEIRDEADEVLACGPLFQHCYLCHEGCWPKTLRGEVSFPETAKVLAVLEGDREVYREKIPRPPRLEMKSEYADDRFVLTWASAKAAARRDEGGDADLWYLVQFLDDGDQWRGLGPRTQEHRADLPIRLFGRSRSLRVRVLGTNGIATGVAETELTLPRPPVSPDLDIVSSAVTSTGRGVAIQVSVIDANGRTHPDPDIVWFDEDDIEIGSGRAMWLPVAMGRQRVVRAVVRDCGAGSCEKLWLLEHQDNGRIAATAAPAGRTESEPVHRHPHRNL